MINFRIDHEIWPHNRTLHKCIFLFLYFIPFLSFYLSFKFLSKSSAHVGLIATMAPDPEVRQRKPEKETGDATTTNEQPSGSPSKSGKKKSTKSRNVKVEYENRWLDVARVLTFLFFLSCGLSYLISSGESFFWTMKVPPKYLRTEWWKSQLVRSHYFISSFIHMMTNNTNMGLITTVWPRLPHPRGAPRLRRFRPRETHLPRHQPHHLRCQRREQDVWSWWILQRLCRR